jgi:hypothetical protein
MRGGYDYSNALTFEDSLVVEALRVALGYSA